MEDRNPDPLDQASRLAEMEREHGVAEVARKAARDQRPLAEGEMERVCAGVDGDDCDELVEPERLAQHAIRCATCQSVVDHRRKQFAP